MAEDAESVSIWRHTCRRNGIREDSSNHQLLVVRKQEKQQLNALIVAPASLTYNWQQEIKRFAPTIRSVVISGSREERGSQLLPADVRITSYASLRQDIDQYQELEFSVFDLG